jgi:uncharacterized membrane protein YgcG
MRTVRFSIAGLIALCSLLVAAVAIFPVHNALAQSQSFHMDRYDTNIQVNRDGSLDVAETLVYVYDSGAFHRGTRLFNLGKFDSISNVQVAEVRDGQTINYAPGSYDPDDSTSGVPNTFGTTTDGGQFKVRWVHDYVSDITQTFRLSYHVNGAVQVFSDHDVFDWYGVPQDWGGYINASRVQVTFPQGADTSNWTTASVPSDAQVTKQGNTVTYSTNDPNAGFEVGAQVPKGVLQATEPQWQNYNEHVRPLVDFGVLVLSLLILVGGILWAIMRWYRAGRDKPVKLLSDYITEPPSNLPPGLVGTLLDESADIRDVIATVVDQGQKGNLTMRETQKGGLFSGKDFEYQQTDTKYDFRFEEMVMNSIFKRGNPVALSELKDTFYSDLPPIYAEMYRSLVALKYFPDNPQAVRSRNRGLGCGLIALGVLLFIAGGALSVYTGWGILAAIAVGIVGLVVVATAGVMPKKTDFGSEEAQKWRAFARYLEQMKRYTDVQAAADKFQKYLPYAVALGIERQLIDQFNSVPTAMPAWYAPFGYYPGYYPVGSTVAGSTEGGPAGVMPQFNPGAAVQGMSDSIAGAMQGMADSFTSMVNSASSAMTSAPHSSSSGSGGWGGGGGGFGGGGGGGGGGGAD